MFKKLIIFSVAAIIFILFCVFTANKVYAADQTITCGESGCNGITGPLFNEINLTPGANIIQTLTAKNNYSQNRSFLIQINTSTFSDSVPSMGDEITLEIIEQESATTVYGPKTITELKEDGEVSLSSIESAGQRRYDFSAYFEDVGNDYQGMTMAFDFRFGFEAITEETTSESSGSSNSNDSGGGEVLGVSTNNIVGNVLGLSATGSGILNILSITVGVLSSLIGVIVIVYYYRKRDEFKVPRIML